VSKTGPVFNRAAGTSTVGLTITNPGASAVTGALAVQLTGLTAGVTLRSASLVFNGKTYNLTITFDSQNRPVLSIPKEVAAGVAAGKALPQIALVFRNPTNLRFDFGTDVYADPLA
jgi:hypothetical protein